MRISAKVDYAVRAMAELAAAPAGKPVRAEKVATAHEIPLAFLLIILSDLRTANLVRGHRGRAGGYSLARPADEITVADVVRAIEGPLARVRDVGLRDLEYTGPAMVLADVWMAVRTSLRAVMENVTLADLVTGRLPEAVAAMVEEYRSEERRRGRLVPGRALAEDEIRTDQTEQPRHRGADDTE